MPYAFRHQPAKGLYLTYQLFSTLLVRIPLWILLAIPRSWRPRKSWSLKRALLVKLVRHSMEITNNTGPLQLIPNHLAIATADGVWVDPVPGLVTGDLRTWMSATSVSPVRIPGYWMHKTGSTIKIAAPPMPGEKVVYALHGGAYTRLSAYAKDPTAFIPRGILEHTNSVHRTFSIEYRLSSTKPYPVANPFPAALLDALAGYNYLVKVVGFSPSDIVVVGDSAGGNLAHALTRYLIEYQNAPGISIPAPPGALLLLSPWSDLGISHEAPGSSSYASAVSDYLGPPSRSVNYAKDAFVGPFGAGAAANNRYISPASLHPSMAIDFKGFPRTFIVAGGAEVLLDQIKTMKERMVKDLGEGNGVQKGEGMVKYLEAKDGIHDYLVFPWHEPERTDTLKEIAKWIEAM